MKANIGDLKTEIERLSARNDILATTMGAIILLLANRGFLHEVTANGMMESLKSKRKENEPRGQT